MGEESEIQLPPNDIVAEQAALGSVMMASWSPETAGAMDDVTAVIKRADDFYRPAHRLIFEAMLAMHAESDPIDPVTLFNALGKRGTVGRVGGGEYLHTLLTSVPTGINAAYYARIVREQAIMRRIVEAGARLTAYGHSGGDPAEIIKRVQEEMGDLIGEHVVEDGIHLGEYLPTAMEEVASFNSGIGVGISTGFKDLDQLLLGLHAGQFVVVGARPAIGKSTLGMDFARAAAKADYSTAIFSLEMGRLAIALRWLSAEAGVSHHKILGGGLDDSDWAKMAQRMGEHRDMPLYIDDSPGLSMMEIRAKCQRLKRKHGLRLVVVDYLQLMEGPDRSENRQQEISKISRALKLLAQELEITVVAMSQLNRGPEQRQDKRPQPSDLRESGSLEQDADTVILLHREDAYEMESPRAGEADIIVAKNRSGPTGTVVVVFQGHYSRFMDMAPGGRRVKTPAPPEPSRT